MHCSKSSPSPWQRMARCGGCNVRSRTKHTSCWTRFVVDGREKEWMWRKKWYLGTVLLRLWCTEGCALGNTRTLACTEQWLSPSTLTWTVHFGRRCDYGSLFLTHPRAQHSHHRRGLHNAINTFCFQHTLKNWNCLNVLNWCKNGIKQQKKTQTGKPFPFTVHCVFFHHVFSLDLANVDECRFF